MDALPFPAWHLFDLKLYESKSRYFEVLKQRIIEKIDINESKANEDILKIL